MLSAAEQKYIKTIFRIAEIGKEPVHTNAIAHQLNTSAAAVTDMIIKLAHKGYIQHEKYHGVSLTAQGKMEAKRIIRRSRLWKVFLIEKLRFPWHEIEGILDDFEAMDKDGLTERLDGFLNYPKFDSFGDSIPNVEGKFTLRAQIVLTDAPISRKLEVIGVRQYDKEFLMYLNSIFIKIGSDITLISRQDYDGTMLVLIDGRHHISIGHDVSQNIIVKIK